MWGQEMLFLDVWTIQVKITAQVNTKTHTLVLS
jgi:hypothetical protein